MQQLAADDGAFREQLSEYEQRARSWIDQAIGEIKRGREDRNSAGVALLSMARNYAKGLIRMVEERGTAAEGPEGEAIIAGAHLATLDVFGNAIVLRMCGLTHQSLSDELSRAVSVDLNPHPPLMTFFDLATGTADQATPLATEGESCSATATKATVSMIGEPLKVAQLLDRGDRRGAYEEWKRVQDGRESGRKIGDLIKKSKRDGREKVYRAEFDKWLAGALSEKSVMTKRIRDFLLLE